MRHKERILFIELPAIGEASKKGALAVVYGVVDELSSGTNDGLVRRKMWLAMKGLTTPCLKLVSAHMAANLVHNVKAALDRFSCKKHLGWLDSTAEKCWICGSSQYKQFVGN